MNLVTVAIGVLAIAFGLYTAWARKANPGQFKKLEPMKKRWGDKTGVAIHVFAYTIIPLVFGAIVLFIGMSGGSIF